MGEVWVDPGIGFGKTPAHNLSLLRHLGDLVAAAAGAGCAGVLVGTSRKRFLGAAGRRPGVGGARPRWPTGPRDRWPRRPQPWWQGVGMVRVHDVAATVQMARLYGPAA